MLGRHGLGGVHLASQRDHDLYLFRRRQPHGDDAVVGALHLLSWDQANDLTGATTGSTSASYAYDGNGLRQSKTVGGTTTHYSWDVDGSLPLLLSDGTNSYIYGLGGTPVEQVSSSGAPTYLLADQLGSTRALTGSAGSLTATFTYDAWGNLAGSTGSATTPFMYAGQYLDSTTGLYYMQARWYDPVTGQFLSVDPDVSQTLSSFAYGTDDPVNESDPSGLSSSGPSICMTSTCLAGRRQALTAACSEGSTNWGDLLVQAVVVIVSIPLDEIGAGEALDALTAAELFGRGADLAADVADTGLSAEDQALQTALDEGPVGTGAPINHLNGAMTEELGWQQALSGGQVGIQGPSAITATGPDYITFDPDTDTINVWDSKFSSSGRFPSGLPAAKLSAWAPRVVEAVDSYSGPYEEEIRQALEDGNVRGRIFAYQPRG